MKFLKNIFSITNSGDRKHKIITLFGIQTKIKLKPQANNIVKHKNYISKFGYYISRYTMNYNNEKVLSELAYMAESQFYWNQENNKLWLLYMTMLLENNKNINKLAQRYFYFFGLKDIEIFPLVADWFIKNGYKNNLIIKSAQICEKIILSKNDNSFYELIKDKSIAIVGNGPSEIGKNKGTQIDNHDVVIRFNEFFTKGYEKDYGTKTDVWVTYFWNPDFLSYEERPDCKFYLWTNDNFYLRKKVSIDNLYPYLDKSWAIVDNNVKKYIWNDLNVSHTVTGGFLIIIYLYKLLGNLKNVDFYGFKFLENNGTEFSHYFKEKYQNNHNHDFEYEAEFLREFIKNNKV